VKYKITIPEPCHEEWSNMTPKEKGRFCDKCQKCVVDFTGLSTQQMFNHINTGGDLCGRFRPDQLNRDLVAAPVKKGFSFQWALSSVIAFTGLTKAFGQSQESFPVGKIAPVETSQNAENVVVPSPLPAKDTITISGTITDERTGEAIPYANVICSELELGCVSDFDGKFMLKLPTEKLSQNTRIAVSFIGYDDVEILIARQSQNQNIEIKLQENAALLGDVCIVKDTPWNRFKAWFKRVF